MRGGAYPFYPCTCGSGKKFKYCCGLKRTGRIPVSANGGAVTAPELAPTVEAPRPGSGAMFEAGPDWFNLPIRGCYLNPGWKDARLASLLVVRGEGPMVYAHAYLVDLMGIGLKDCYPLAPMSERQFKKSVLGVFQDRVGGADEIDLRLAGRIVLGGLRLARSRGFEVPACADRCVEAMGRRLLPEELDMSLFDPVTPEEERLPLLSMERVEGSSGKRYRVLDADPAMRVEERIRDARSFAKFYGGHPKRWAANRGDSLIMPLYNSEDLDGIRLMNEMGLEGTQDIVCFSRVIYRHSDISAAVRGLNEWMDVRMTRDAGDETRLAWERDEPKQRKTAFGLFRGARQSMGEVTITPMHIVLETRSRLFLYAGRIWIENALPLLRPSEFRYTSLQDLLP